jgi:hypothetical protein
MLLNINGAKVMKRYVPAQDEPEVVERMEEAIAHGYVAVCSCRECQQIPLFQNAPLQDFIQTEKDESEGKSERNKR